MSKILSFSYPTVSQYNAGELLEYALSAPSFLLNLLLSLNQITASVSLMFAALIVLFTLSIPLTGIIFCIFTALWCCQRILFHNLQHASLSHAESSMTLSSETHDALNGLMLVHIYNLKSWISTRFKQNIHQLSTQIQKLFILQGSCQPIHEFMAIFGMALSVMISYYVFSHSSQTTILPIIIGFQAVTYKLSSRLGNISHNFATVQTSLGKIQQIQAIFDTPDPYIQTGERQLAPFQHTIRFSDTEFAYGSKTIPTINKCNFSIRQGQITALVGESGSGKSTLINLILKLYEPTQGCIYIDSLKLSDIDGAAWRKCIGVVTQDAYMLNTSIKTNISLGKLDATDDEIIHAARLAGAHSFISVLKDGYNTSIGDRGMRLSGGERQRIALARALVRNPDILILDEATSNLDSESEACIQESIDQLKAEKTIIVIAHRLSTIAQADAIIVIKNGEVVEQGTHLMLVEQKGPYANFWNLQFSKFANSNA